MAGKKVPSASQMSAAERLEWINKRQEISDKALSNIHTLASHAKVLYDDFIEEGSTKNEYVISALLHGIMAISSEVNYE